MPQSGLRGLSEEEAAARLASDGPNALPSGRGRSLRRILAEALREPMLLLLIVAAALYLLLGDLGEGLFMVAGGAAAAGLVVVQEARSERALAALRLILSACGATVVPNQLALSFADQAYDDMDRLKKEADIEAMKAMVRQLIDVSQHMM